MKLERGNTRAGAALLLSLWALFVLSALVISWAINIDSRLAQNGNATRVLEAEAEACSGSELALNPGVAPGSSLLRGSLGPGQSYEARVSGEGGRLNINWAVAGENPQRLELLRRYLEAKGIELNERDHMIDCLLDWVDPDNLVRLNGAEDDGDYHPANQLLTRIDDLKRVKGWAEFCAKPGWDSEITVNSTGPIDLAWASRDLLLSIPGMTEQIVDAFLTLRAGPDGVEGTDDDADFKSIDEVRTALGLSPDQFKQVAPLVTFHDQVMRVVSVGRSGDVKRTVQMIVHKSGNIPQMVTWKEF